MYIEGWMFVLAVIAFCACAYLSRGSGVKAGYFMGTNAIIQTLVQNKIISIVNGQIVPYKDPNSGRNFNRNTPKQNLMDLWKDIYKND